MERLSVTIQAESPLCFSERRPAGQFRGTVKYIPGSVIRGAVAELMMKDGLENSSEFEHLFMSRRPAVFSNAYVAPHVFPATAMSCKAENGLRSEGKHGVIDSLVERLCFEALEPAGLVYLPECSYRRPDGRRCGARLERFGGFYRRDGDAFRSQEVTQRLLTRAAINRRRGVAEDELLYSPVVISEGNRKSDEQYCPTRFTATVTTNATKDAESQLIEYLGRVSHLGSGRSRGLGHVRVKVDSVPVRDEEDRESIRDRCQKLNDAIKEFWYLLKELPACSKPEHNPDSGTYFTIDFYSDAVLKENGWIPTTILTEQMLQDYCNVEDKSLKLVRAYTGYDYRGGWNMAWGLPKDVDVVAPMGSVFVFWTSEPDLWYEALLEIERWGIGERTAEGFGQVRVCDEFHVPARRDRPA